MTFFFATPNGTPCARSPSFESGVQSCNRRRLISGLQGRQYLETVVVEKIMYARRFWLRLWYGLPELNRIHSSARLVANPGCYPTAVQLGFLPLLAKGLVDTQRLVADAKRGAGRVEVQRSPTCYGARCPRALRPMGRLGIAICLKSSRTVGLRGQSVGLTLFPSGSNGPRD